MLLVLTPHDAMQRCYSLQLMDNARAAFVGVARPVFVLMGVAMRVMGQLCT